MVYNKTVLSLLLIKVIQNLLREGDELLILADSTKCDVGSGRCNSIQLAVLGKNSRNKVPTTFMQILVYTSWLVSAQGNQYSFTFISAAQLINLLKEAS